MNSFQRIILTTFLALLTGTFIPNPVFCQEVLIGDENYPVIPLLQRNKPADQHHFESRTTALSLPFLDDFSRNDFFPDPLLWVSDTSDDHLPGLSISKGLNPPSKGVATFDGATLMGTYYATVIAYGVADTLTSQLIDLSSLNTGSNVWMSFFVQPGGRGDKPEYNDSLVLYFDTTGTYNYKRVWGVPGDSLNSSKFSRVMIPLDQSIYFHSNFRFKFVSYSSLNGELDQWHLDYVYLNSGRNASDTARNDISIINFDRGILNGYTALPPDQINSAPSLMQNFEVETSSLKTSAGNTNLKVTIADPLGGNTFTGTTVQTSSASLNPYANTMVSVNAFSDQNLANDGAIRFTGWVNDGASDLNAVNDTIRIDYRSDSILAYDDGVADIGYGLTSARSFCQEFNIFKPDTITAVWIRWVPTVYYNPSSGQSFGLEGKQFWLNIWKELHPDSFAVQQLTGMEINYGNSPNEFRRYPLFNALSVDSIFYVGIEQVDIIPIGIGFDKNVVNDSKIYYESVAGAFVNTNQQGTLMIRPEFGRFTLIGNENPVEVNSQINIFPNPIEGEQVNVSWNADLDMQNVQVTIFDITGKEILSETISTDGNSATVQLNGQRVPGIYFAKIRCTKSNGDSFEQIKKIIIK